MSARAADRLEYDGNDVADDDDDDVAQEAAALLEEEKKQKEEKVKRRKTRADQQSVADVFADQVAEMEDLNSGLFRETKEIVNEINKGISHSREQLTDSIIFKQQSLFLRNMASKLDDSSRRFDYPSWSVALTKTFCDPASNIFNWTNLGRDVGCLFLTAPAVTVMLGPLSRPPVIRKAMMKKAPRQASVEVIPEEIEQKKEEDEEATNERIQVQKSFIKKLSYPNYTASTMKKKNGASQYEESQPFDLLGNLVDPDDPVQTVENLFDFAFLIKEKEVMQAINSTTQLPEAKHTESHLLADKDRRQMVLTIGMKDLKNLSKYIKERNIKNNANNNTGGAKSGDGEEKDMEKEKEKGKAGKCPLHRDDDLYSAKNAQEQADILARKADSKKKKPTVGGKRGADTVIESSQTKSSNKKSSQAQSQASSSSSSSSSIRK